MLLSNQGLEQIIIEELIDACSSEGISVLLRPSKSCSKCVNAVLNKVFRKFIVINCRHGVGNGSEQINYISDGFFCEHFFDLVCFGDGY